LDPAAGYRAEPRHYLSKRHPVADHFHSSGRPTPPSTTFVVNLYP
jgi:hypothetical protein